MFDKLFDFTHVNIDDAATAINQCLGRQGIPSNATINGKTLAEYLTNSKVANFMPVFNALLQNITYDKNIEFDRLTTDNETYRFNIGGGSTGEEKDSFASCFISQVDQSAVVVSGN